MNVQDWSISQQHCVFTGAVKSNRNVIKLNVTRIMRSYTVLVHSIKSFICPTNWGMEEIA